MGARPLSSEERAEAEQIARRLRAELRAVVDLMPAEERGASVMSRVLGIDRATCQRLVATVARAEEGAETLVQLPGVEGLRSVIVAIGNRIGAGQGAEQLAGAVAAIDRFAQVLEELAGSQRKLKERLEAGARRDGADPRSLAVSDDPTAREAMFPLAAAIVGRWSEVSLHTTIIRPVAGSPHLTETVRVRAMLGHVAQADSVPLEIGETAPLRPQSPGGSNGGNEKAAFATLDARPATGRTPGSLLPAFCSTPLPRVTSRSVGVSTVHVIDSDESIHGRPVDIVTAHRATRPDAHPATRRPAIGEVSTILNMPARTLVLDTFLHRDIARRCIPTLEVHLWTPRPGEPLVARWSTRLPGGPRLEVLGSGIRGAATRVYPRYQELLGEVFGQLEWPGDEFVGYRCETSFPIWRAGYCMLFDFSGNELEQHPA